MIRGLIVNVVQVVNWKVETLVSWGKRSIKGEGFASSGKQEAVTEKGARGKKWWMIGMMAQEPKSAKFRSQILTESWCIWVSWRT